MAKISNKQKYALEDLARANLSGAELKLIQDYEANVKTKGINYVVKPFINDYGKIVPDKYKIYKDGKYIRTTKQSEMKASLERSKDIPAVAPDNEEPMVMEPKHDKAKKFDSFILSMVKKRQVKDKQDFVTVACSVDKDDKAKLDAMAKLMGHKSISSVLKAFCDQLLEDADKWEYMIKHSKN